MPVMGDGCEQSLEMGLETHEVIGFEPVKETTVLATRRPRITKVDFD
jgi:hypothetical protein